MRGGVRARGGVGCGVQARAKPGRIEIGDASRRLGRRTRALERGPAYRGRPSGAVGSRWASRGANPDTQRCVSIAAAVRPRGGSSGHDPRDRSARSSAAGQTIRRSSLGCSRGGIDARGRGALGRAAGVGRRGIAGSHGVLRGRCAALACVLALVEGRAGRQCQALLRRLPHRRRGAALERQPCSPCARAAARAPRRRHGNTGAA